MSRGAIFMVDRENRLLEMREQPYDDELVLQQLLADYPHLLAGDQMGDGPARQWLLVSREMPIWIEDEVSAHGYLDHLFLDQDAIPTLVEVKRSTDTRIRREVVGQMLDYAANAARYWPIEKMRAYFERRFREPGAADRALGDFLADADPEEFWRMAKTNLQAGKVRLVFVADVIPPSLKSIIEFLNGQMDPAEVLGVEVRQYVGDDVKTLVPRVIGRTSASENRKPRTQREPWTEADIRTRLKEKKGEAAVAIADQILDWARGRMPNFFFGRGSADGSVIPRVFLSGHRYLFFGLWTYGAVELQLQWMRYMPGFEPDERRREFLDRINGIPGVAVPLDAIARRPSFDIMRLASPEARRAFLDVMEWALSVARESPAPAPEAESTAPESIIADPEALNDAPPAEGIGWSG
jgi:hypothetical protein